MFSSSAVVVSWAYRNLSVSPRCCVVSIGLLPSKREHLGLILLVSMDCQHVFVLGVLGLYFIYGEIFCMGLLCVRQRSSSKVYIWYPPRLSLALLCGNDFGLGIS